MNLRLCGRLQRGALQLDVDLQVAAGSTLALVGPNGAGKSTCLQLLAGLLRLQAGELQLGATMLDAPATGQFVPPETRAVGYLPQDPLLFPHLSVRDNVAYGLRARGVAAAAAHATAGHWLARVGLADFAARRPRSLSGGEAQRVSLARALAAGPRMLLLDEPLAAVDASARLQLRRELLRQLTDFAGPRVLVTHDVVDAFALADSIAVLEAGRIVQAGAPAEIGSRPHSAYVADLVGLNFLRGQVHDSVLTTTAGWQLVVATAITGDAIAVVHPRAIALFAARPTGSPRNVWPTTVVGIENVLHGRRVQLGAPVPLVAEVTPAAVASLGLGIGREVYVAVKATEVQVYSA